MSGTVHRIVVDIMGSTANPGNFTWRCCCGKRNQMPWGWPSWDAAEVDGSRHIEDES